MITADSVDTGIHAWLYRKGFRTRAALECFEAIGGSFAKSAFLLWLCLPRRPKDVAISTARIPLETKTRNSSRVFPAEKLHEMRDLYNKMQEEWRKEAGTLYSDSGGLFKYDAIAMSSKPLKSSNVSRSSESPEHHEALEIDDESDTGSALDIEGLNEIFAAGERDDLEATGLTLLSSQSGKLQVEITRVSSYASDISTRKPYRDPAYGELTQLEIKIQVSLLNGRVYRGYDWWSGHKSKNCRKLRGIKLLVHSVNRIIIQDFYAKDNKEGIIVQVELAPLGERHPNAFVISETRDDTASRLAFRVTLKDDKGDQKVLYLKSPQSSLEVIFKANSLVDWLEGATLNTLKTRCRRHIYMNPTNITVAEDLKFFLGGAYILDDGSRSKNIPSPSTKRTRGDSNEPEPEYPRGNKAAK